MSARIAGMVAGFWVALAGVGLADAPADSRRPDARPAAASTPRAPVSALRLSPLPLPRPGVAVRGSARPAARPGKPPHRDVVQAAVQTRPTTAVAATRTGSVCGDRGIRGQTLSPIPGKLKGCGIAAPVRVTAVDGVTLSQPATLNCRAAKALKTWVKTSVKPAVGRRGGGVKSLTVLSHYSCRTRNNKPGAKLSEHATGNAIDIASINLANGVSLSVLKGWNDRVQSRILKAVHRQACGTFGTVLGPDADRYHRNHFHLDVARYRGGTYCR